MLYINALEGEWEPAIEIFRRLTEGNGRNVMIFPFFTHVEMINSIICRAVLMLYRKKKMDNDEDSKLIKSVLIEMRTKLEVFGQTLPGIHKCSGAVFAAQMSLELE